MRDGQSRHSAEEAGCRRAGLSAIPCPRPHRLIAFGLDRLMGSKHAELHCGYDLIIDEEAYKWPMETITGAQIKELGGSPADWVVMLFVEGPDACPEIDDHQPVNLDPRKPPWVQKRFLTRERKPA